MAKPACEEQLPRIEMAGDGFLRRTSFRVQLLRQGEVVWYASQCMVYVVKRRNFRSMIVVASYIDYSTLLTHERVRMKGSVVQSG